MSVIDLRSDTVTRPTPEMRRAMAEAEVGDDVLRDDPTVNALEERAAELLGKEASLFVSSGTQGNLVSQLAHLQRGMETIAGRETHIVMDEAAGHASIVHTSIHSIPEEPDGSLDLTAVENAIQPDDVHAPITGMVAIENTHAMSMAQPLSPEYTRAVADVAHRHGVPLHIDGARFFNAVVAHGVQPVDLAGPADSVTFCLSKGLSCPIGSMVVGSSEFIFRARRARKLVGGGMRQVGVLAACGLIALRDGPAGMIDRLAEDHANTRRLAEALAEMPGVYSPGGVSQPTPGRFDPERARTNFVLFNVERDREAFLEELATRGVLMVGYPHGMIRAATHYGVTAADIEIAIKIVREALDANLSARTRGDRAPVGRRFDDQASRGGRTLNSRAPGNLAARNRNGIPAIRSEGERPTEVPVPRLTRPDGGLTRPPSDAGGPLDDNLYDLVEDRFRRLLRDHPAFATFVGIHEYDGLLGDGTRDAVEAESVAERAHLAAVEAVDPAGLSETGRFERELEIHNVRRSLFDADEHRVWERRSTAMDSVGDAIFAIFVRDFAPLEERLDAISARLEATPRHLDEHRTRAVVPQVRLWQQREIESAEQLPGLFEEILGAGRTVLAEPELKRLERATAAATASVATYADSVHETLARGVDDWPLGREKYDELIRLRAFDGLDADAILEIGKRQLAENKARRVAAAREIDSTVDEPAVVDRIKRDHPGTFDEALDAYRDVMHRARRHLIDRDIVTVPPHERIEVLATPEYLRNVIPFAAYFEPPKFDRRPSGIYVVTPSVNHDPNAMREHNRSSISNTSIHEAYPGHHLQLSVATLHPSLTRLITDAPEFVEGWGMYSEQMMREEGFDDAANFRLNMHTDAIWRACRIILDVRMHRGEIGVEEAISWMVEQTSFEEPNARAEVYRYTYTPTYQLSYLLGKVLLLQLRDDERRRLGPGFSLKRFHDTLLRNGSLPISFHRRLLEAEGLLPERV